MRDRGLNGSFRGSSGFGLAVENTWVTSRGSSDFEPSRNISKAADDKAVDQVVTDIDATWPLTSKTFYDL